MNNVYTVKKKYSQYTGGLYPMKQQTIKTEVQEHIVQNLLLQNVQMYHCQCTFCISPYKGNPTLQQTWNLSVCFEKLIKNENTLILTCTLIYFYLFTILDRLLGQSRANAKVMYSAKRVHACKVSQLFLCKIIRILWW